MTLTVSAAEAARFELNVELRVIRIHALKAMEHADGRYPEIHQALASIVSLVDDAQQSLKQAREPIDVRARLERLDESPSDCEQSWVDECREMRAEWDRS